MPNRPGDLRPNPWCPGGRSGGCEKHVPVREDDLVRVGSAEHPMVDNHYIEWIERIGEGTLSRRFLRPGDCPRAEFPGAGAATLRAYCNVHGLWKG